MLVLTLVPNASDFDEASQKSGQGSVNEDKWVGGSPVRIVPRASCAAANDPRLETAVCGDFY